MTFRIEIDVDECMSAGKCVADYPEAFEFDDEELAKLADPKTLSDEDMVRVARNCPSRALLVFDQDDNAIYN